MVAKNEGQLFTPVVDGPAEVFPQLPRQRVTSEVDSLRPGSADAKIRTYVPVLVQRQARERLAAGASTAPRACPVDQVGG